MYTWELDAITSVPDFLIAVVEHLPAVQTVCFEIEAASSDARKIYAKHHSTTKYRPLRDTISPRTQLHYCTISKRLADDLARLLRHEEVTNVFWHVKGFGPEKLLFSLHDADLQDSVCLSPQVDSKIVRAIGLAIGRKPKKIQTRYNWDENHKSGRLR